MDRYVVFLLVIGFISWIVIIPRDAKRFGWSPPFPLALEIAGIALLAGSFFLFFRSYPDNHLPVSPGKGSRRSVTSMSYQPGFMAS
jgi:hypothetical protein